MNGLILRNYFSNFRTEGGTMPDYSQRIGNSLRGFMSGGAILGAYGMLTKSDSEIRKDQMDEYLKYLLQKRGESLDRLSSETTKNFGRINRFTTGNIERAQGDISRRAAGGGRTADEADFLATRGELTGQGSQAIQNTQTAADAERRKIMD